MGAELKNKLIKIILSFLIISAGSVAWGEENDKKLGEVEDCPKGCECITDTARGKLDKSGLVNVLEEDQKKSDGSGTSTKSK